MPLENHFLKNAGFLSIKILQLFHKTLSLISVSLIDSVLKYCQYSRIKVYQ